MPCLEYAKLLIYTSMQQVIQMFRRMMVNGMIVSLCLVEEPLTMDSVEKYTSYKSEMGFDHIDLVVSMDGEVYGFVMS